MKTDQKAHALPQAARSIVVAGNSALRGIRWQRRVYGELTWRYPSPAEERDARRHAAGNIAACDLEQLERQGFVSDCIPSLSVAVGANRNRRSTGTALRRVTLPQTPRGSLAKAGAGLFAYSPALCILDAARSIDTPQLLMLMEELCGLWSLPETGPADTGHFNDAIDFTDKPCGYFEASPCLAVDELRAFIARAPGLRGQQHAERAARHALGNARSPMESIMGLMFSLPHAQGGLNCGNVILNYKIRLSTAAARIANMPYIIADAYLPESQTILEYNGAYHDAPGIRKRDENRTLALQSMGFSVFRINNEQLRDPDALESIARIIFKARGLRYRPRSRNHAMDMPALLDKLRQSVGLHSLK